MRLDFFVHSEDCNMAGIVFNYCKGESVEKFRDSSAKGIVLLLRTVPTNDVLRDLGSTDKFETVFEGTILGLLVVANEANFTNYARKTGITGTITVDDTNERTDLDLPDQTWIAAGGIVNNTLQKLVVAYEDGAQDAERKLLTFHDFPVITNGGDVTARFNSSGFFRAN